MKSKYGFTKKILLVFILMCLSLFSCSSDISYDITDTTTSSSLTSYEEVANYIKENGKLPDNFITKSEARNLGWEANEGNLAEVAPGKSIGGDRFYNYEGKLPEEPGRIYYECDINYTSGYRGGERLIFSNDGLIFKTEDHYQTFTEIK